MARCFATTHVHCAQGLVDHFFPIRGSCPVKAPTWMHLRQEDLEVLTERPGDPPTLPFNKLPQQAAHGHCQAQNAQYYLGTGQFQNSLHIAGGGLQRWDPKEEGRVVGLITLHGPRASTTLPILPLGVPYLLVEHAAHLGACRHPDYPACPRLIAPEDHLCLLPGAPQSDLAHVDELLNHPNTRPLGWFVSF